MITQRIGCILLTSGARRSPNGRQTPVAVAQRRYFKFFMIYIVLRYQ